MFLKHIIMKPIAMKATSSTTGISGQPPRVDSVYVWPDRRHNSSRDFIGMHCHGVIAS
jgi:hypothetical protein